MSKPVQFGKVYRDPILNLFYVVVAYHDRVPDIYSSALTNVYEVVKLNKPDDKSYAAVKTVEDLWELVGDKDDV